MFDYKSPITQILGEMQTEYENGVLKAVQSVGFHVDKEELAKALVYDREQYEKGYADGLNADKWITCSERLPQEDEPEAALCEIVNITLKNGAVTVGWCNRYLEKWFVVDEHCDYPIPYKYEDVTAWQPLPAPYQKGE